jgi:hypothetical protein
MKNETGQMRVLWKTTEARWRCFSIPSKCKTTLRRRQEKRPIFDEKMFLKKLVPGDSTLVVDRPMRPSDVEEHPIEWARFEQKKEQPRLRHSD